MSEIANRLRSDRGAGRVHWLDCEEAADLIEALEHALRGADAMHGELLKQIDGLMSAKAGTWEAEKLSELADIVQAYERARFHVG